jgi:hypothetical protein
MGPLDLFPKGKLNPTEFWMVCIAAILFVLLCVGAHGIATPAPHANCCLCMCHAKDETKCSAMCIRLQHGKKIIELPEMNACTNECKRVHVVPVKP